MRFALADRLRALCAVSGLSGLPDVKIGILMESWSNGGSGGGSPAWRERREDVGRHGEKRRNSEKGEDVESISF